MVCNYLGIGDLPPHTLRFIFIAVSLGLLFTLFANVKIVEDDANFSVVDLVRRWGYPAEAVDVTTKDGYILEMQRIRHGINGDSNSSTPRPVILMMHGLHGSSYNWIINLPHQSPGFMFADAGFDVWLGNCRGNMYGQRHRTLNPFSHAFWDFTWEDMADQDIPAIVDHILNVTGQTSLYYMGHSQGYAIVTAHLSQEIGFRDKIRAVFGVAPVWTNAYSWGPAVVVSYKRPIYEIMYNLFGARQYHAKSATVISTIAKYICRFPFADRACGLFLESFGGMPTGQLNFTRTSVYMASTPAGSSTKNCIHWAQICHRNSNLRYDYGEKKNRERYGQSTPPSFNISRVSTPNYLYWSLEDWLADDEDININLLPFLADGVVQEAKIIPGFNHFDFIFGTDAAEKIYSPILRKIEEIEEGRTPLEVPYIRENLNFPPQFCSLSSFEQFSRVVLNNTSIVY